MTHSRNVTKCPACGAQEAESLYRVACAPTHSVLLHKSRSEALEYPSGEISLFSCPICGFIFNAKYDPSLQDYRAEYESTQSYSPTFDKFSRSLAQKLIDRYDLHGKRILEIGCGMGEFLSQICVMGDNRGLGFDPAYQPGRVPSNDNIEFIKDFYSEQYAHQRADFVICKMTLEHIGNVTEFVGMVHSALVNSPHAIVFFQVPDASRVLEEIAFWDIYYEHCSYFTATSLEILFRRSGFEILRLENAYDHQYLMIEARLSPDQVSKEEEKSAVLIEFTKIPRKSSNQPVVFFRDKFAQRLSDWQQFLNNAKQQGKHVALWGGGSKAVAFLTTLGVTDEIAYCVDINPHKRNTITAGSGHEIIVPEDLSNAPPDVVIVLNPIYLAEIRQCLTQLGLAPEIISITKSF